MECFHETRTERFVGSVLSVGRRVRRRTGDTVYLEKTVVPQREHQSGMEQVRAGFGCLWLWRVSVHEVSCGTFGQL